MIQRIARLTPSVQDGIRCSEKRKKKTMEILFELNSLKQFLRKRIHYNIEGINFMEHP